MIYKANHTLYTEDARNSVESVLNLTQEILAHEKQLALSVALMLSQNEALKSSYQTLDRDRAFLVLQEELLRIQKYLAIEHLDVQLHTHDAKAWVRSWDKESYGEDLRPFRKGLTALHETQAPLVSIELGKRLNIKALCPIVDNGSAIGSLEVILGFDTLAEQLKEKKIHLLVLMDESLLDIGTWMKDLEHINDFVLVTNSCGHRCHDLLQSLLHPKILEDGFARKEGLLFGFTPLFDMEAKRIGYLGVWFEDTLLKESLLLRSTLLPKSQPLPVSLSPLPDNLTPTKVLIR